MKPNLVVGIDIGSYSDSMANEVSKNDFNKVKQSTTKLINCTNHLLHVCKIYNDIYIIKYYSYQVYKSLIVI